MRNIKAIIHLFRHGARTSSTIGRIEDNQLSNERKGLTYVGLIQMLYKGNLARKDTFIENNIKEGSITFHISERSRVIDSCYSFLDGLLSNTEYDSSFIKEETNTIENIFNSPKFCSTKKYSHILDKHSYKPSIINNNPNIKFMKYYKNYNKIDSLEDKLKFDIKSKLLDYENTNSNKILVLYPYFYKLFTKDLPYGIYDFKNEVYINKETLKPEKLNFFQIFKLYDFIKCNKFYEDIPIYDKYYEHFIPTLKELILSYFYQTISRKVSYLRVKFILDLIFDIASQEEKSYNVIITHDTQLKSFINLFLSDESINNFIDLSLQNDKYFFLLHPKFASEIKIIVYENNDIQISFDNFIINEFCHKELLSYDLIKLDNLKNYINKF